MAATDFKWGRGGTAAPPVGDGPGIRTPEQIDACSQPEGVVAFRRICMAHPVPGIRTPEQIDACSQPEGVVAFRRICMAHPVTLSTCPRAVANNEKNKRFL